MAESVVTSVPDPSTFSPSLPSILTSHHQNPDNNNNNSSNNSNNHLIHLDLRNEPFTIDREALMELPESILLCLFPNGVVLSQKQSNNPNQTQNNQDQEHEVYFVDFDGPCLSYILHFFSQARLSYYGTTSRPCEPPQLQSQLPSPLFCRQAIIVLREELEYFAIPPSSDPNLGSTAPLNSELKQACGDSLLENKSIFTALQRNVNRQKNTAEQHLINMLCMSGFGTDDDWAYRTPEPRRCSISSLALVLLKTGIAHESPAGVEMTGPSNLSRMNPTVDTNQLTIAQKLLLFWRKPARKCWWDATDLTITLSDQQTRAVKLWARRVWTLELSLI